MRATPDPKRLIRAWVASVVTGVVIYYLVIRLGLPALSNHLTDAQVEWLRIQFRAHPARVMASIAAAAAILALPVLAAFRLAYGPFRASVTGPTEPTVPTDDSRPGL